MSVAGSKGRAAVRSTRNAENTQILAERFLRFAADWVNDAQHSLAEGDPVDAMLDLRHAQERIADAFRELKRLSAMAWEE